MNIESMNESETSGTSTTCLPEVRNMEINEAVDWCEGCHTLREELSKLKAEHTLNYTTLKEKIISTDLLIKKYKAKCHESEIQLKKNEELQRNLEKYRNDCELLETRLKIALQESEPLKQKCESLERIQHKHKPEMDAIKDKLESSEASNRMFTNAQDISEAKIKKLDDELKEANVNIKSLETRNKKQDSLVHKLQVDVELRKTELKSQRKVISDLAALRDKHNTRVNQLEKQLTDSGHVVRGVPGRRTRAARMTPSRVVRRRTNIDADRTSSDEDVMLTKLLQDDDSDGDGFNLFRPIGHALSPLPPSPPSIEDDVSDDSLDDMAEVLETALSKPHMKGREEPSLLLNKHLQEDACKLLSEVPQGVCNVQSGLSSKGVLQLQESVSDPEVEPDDMPFQKFSHSQRVLRTDLQLSTSSTSESDTESSQTQANTSPRRSPRRRKSSTNLSDSDVETDPSLQRRRTRSMSHDSSSSSELSDGSNSPQVITNAPNLTNQRLLQNASPFKEPLPVPPRRGRRRRVNCKGTLQSTSNMAEHTGLIRTRRITRSISCPEEPPDKSENGEFERKGDVLSTVDDSLCEIDNELDQVGTIPTPTENQGHDQTTDFLKMAPATKHIGHVIQNPLAPKPSVVKLVAGQENCELAPDDNVMLVSNKHEEKDLHAPTLSAMQDTTKIPSKEDNTSKGTHKFVSCRANTDECLSNEKCGEQESDVIISEDKLAIGHYPLSKCTSTGFITQTFEADEPADGSTLETSHSNTSILETAISTDTHPTPLVSIASESICSNSNLKVIPSIFVSMDENNSKSETCDKDVGETKLSGSLQELSIKSKDPSEQKVLVTDCSRIGSSPVKDGVDRKLVEQKASSQIKSNHEHNVDNNDDKSRATDMNRFNVDAESPLATIVESLSTISESVNSNKPKLEKSAESLVDESVMDEDPAINDTLVTTVSREEGQYQGECSIVDKVAPTNASVNLTNPVPKVEHDDNSGKGNRAILRRQFSVDAHGNSSLSLKGVSLRTKFQCTKESGNERQEVNSPSLGVLPLSLSSDDLPIADLSSSVDSRDSEHISSLVEKQIINTSTTLGTKGTGLLLLDVTDNEPAGSKDNNTQIDEKSNSENSEVKPINVTPAIRPTTLMYKSPSASTSGANILQGAVAMGLLLPQQQSPVVTPDGNASVKSETSYTNKTPSLISETVSPMSSLASSPLEKVECITPLSPMLPSDQSEALSPLSFTLSDTEDIGNPISPLPPSPVPMVRDPEDIQTKTGHQSHELLDQLPEQEPNSLKSLLKEDGPKLNNREQQSQDPISQSPGTSNEVSAFICPIKMKDSNEPGPDVSLDSAPPLHQPKARVAHQSDGQTCTVPPATCKGKATPGIPRKCSKSKLMRSVMVPSGRRTEVQRARSTDSESSSIVGGLKEVRPARCIQSHKRQSTDGPDACPVATKIQCTSSQQVAASIHRDMLAMVRRRGADISGVVTRLLKNPSPECMQLIVSAIMKVCHTQETDLMSMLYMLCIKSTKVPWTPYIAEHEAKIIKLLLQLITVNVYKDLVRLFIDTACDVILDADCATLLVRVSLCRICISLCRQLYLPGRASILIYDMVASEVTGFPMLTLAVASVWPELLQRSIRPAFHGPQTLVCAVEYVVMRRVSSDKTTLTKLARCLQSLCQWTPPGEDCDANSLVAKFLEQLQMEADKPKPDKDILCELEKSVIMVARTENWMWTNNVLIVDSLWPRLQKWAVAQTRNTTSDVSHTMCESLVRLMGHIITKCPAAHIDAANDVINMMRPLVIGVPGATIPANIQQVALETLLRLAPFAAKTVAETTETWLCTHPEPTAVPSTGRRGLADWGASAIIDEDTRIRGLIRQFVQVYAKVLPNEEGYKNLLLMA